jgi:hypothetical protein
MIRLATLIHTQKDADPISTSEEFKSFAEARHKGAKDIADKAQKKGGPAILTYHHFVVKLPYYGMAMAGEFNPLTAAEELRVIVGEVGNGSGTWSRAEQIGFQELIGRLEVVGELLIKWNECNRTK